MSNANEELPFVEVEYTQLKPSLGQCAASHGHSRVSVVRQRRRRIRV